MGKQKIANMVSKEMGINTAIESMGFAKYETLASILAYVDVYLMDRK